MRKEWLIVALLVAGCTKHEDLATSAVGPNPTPASSAPRPDSPVPPTSKEAVPPVGAPKATDASGSNPPEPTGGDQKSTKKGRLPEIPTKAAQGWHSTKLQPLDLARKMDIAFATLQGVNFDSRIDYAIPTGVGRVNTHGYFSKPNVFSVQFPVMVDGHPAVQTVRSDGKNMSTIKGAVSDAAAAGWAPIRPIPPATDANGAAIVDGWPVDMPQLSLMRFTKGKNVWSPFVAALLNRSSEFAVVSEERTAPYGRLLITDYRVLAKRKPGPAKTKGELEYEVVIDGKHFVPVTMRVRSAKPGKKRTEIDVATKWEGGAGKPGNFKLPKS